MSVDQAPRAVLDRNINYAKGLVKAGQAMEKLRPELLDPADLHRAAWTQSVSAFDHWLHEEVYARVEVLARRATQARGPMLKKLALPLELVEKTKYQNMDFGDAVGEHLRAVIGRTSFHQARPIADAVRYVRDLDAKQVWAGIAEGISAQYGYDTSLTAEQAKHEHRQIVDRRNEIAHAADLDPATNERRPMSATEAYDAVIWIKHLAQAVEAVMDGRLR